MTKRELRQEMKLRAGAFAPGGEPAALWSRLETTAEFAQAQTVLIYMALGDEVPTAEFILRWNGKKRLAIPLVCGESLVLKEYKPDAVKRGYAGVTEPESGLPTIDPKEIDLAVIPGQAFDLKCNRMGRGKGYYDRLLPELNCVKAGVGYDFRIVPQLPCDAWDIPLDMVVTPTRTILRSDPQR